MVFFLIVKSSLYIYIFINGILIIRAIVTLTTTGTLGFKRQRMAYLYKLYDNFNFK